MKIALLIIFSVTFFITNVYENYYRDKERESYHPAEFTKRYGRLWHRMQWLNWFLVISFTTYLYFDLSYLWGALILLSAALWWIMYDGVLNSLKKKYFFYQSPNTTSDLEPFANIYVKIILLVISLTILLVTK